MKAIFSTVLLAGGLLQTASAHVPPLVNHGFSSLQEGHTWIRNHVASNPAYKVRNVAEHELRPARRATGRRSDSWRPFRLKFDYRLDVVQSPDSVAYVTEKLMPAVAEVIGNALEAKVEEPPFELPDIDWGDGEGLVAPTGVQDDADLVVVVGSLPQSWESWWCPPGVLASATWLAQGEVSNRPVYGLTVLCQFSPDTFSEDLHTAVHEVMHILGFTPSDFLGEDQQFVKQAEDGRVLVVGPRVREYMRAHFGCDELEGALIEDDGGEGSTGAHWESRLFEEDLMNWARGSHEQHTSRPMMTALTLAYFEDTEWYNVNYSPAGILSYGLNSGCSLVIGTYEEALLDPAAAAYLCDLDQALFAEMCTHDASAIGWCHNFTWTYDDFAKVDLAGAEWDGVQLECQAKEAGSRCLGHQDPYAYSDVDPKYYPSCVSMSCSDQNKVLVDGKPCETTLGKDGWACPDAEKFCVSPGYLTCLGELNDCNTHGDCYEGNCFCHVGYGGDDCSIELCVGECSDGSECPASGFCGERRNTIETFKEHILKVYHVHPKPVPHDYTGLANTYLGADNSTQSSMVSRRLLHRASGL